MERLPGFRVIAFFAATAIARADGLPVAHQADAFPLDRVRLLDGPFQHAQELGRAYLLAHYIDRLLAPFRLEAGLAPKAPKYPNWESSGLDDHTAGHYLTALAQMWAATGDAECKCHFDAMVADLAECQRAGRTNATPGRSGVAVRVKRLFIGGRLFHERMKEVSPLPLIPAF